MLYSILIRWVFGSLPGVWHVSWEHQSYLLGLGHLYAQHSASTADAAAYLAHVWAIPQVSLFCPTLVTTIATYYLPVFEPQFGPWFPLWGNHISWQSSPYCLSVHKDRWQPKGIGILSYVGRHSLKLKSDWYVKRKYYFNLLPKPFVVFCLIANLNS